MKAAPCWVALAAVTGLLSMARPTFARSAGVAALGCDACHRGGKAATVTLTSEPANPAVGQPITLTIGVSQTNGSTAGFYLTTANQAPGKFEAIESGTVASATEVMHTMPRAGSGGTTTFKAHFTATQATGVEFDVYALSANGDRTNQGDGPGTAKLALLIGCTGATYYIDQDGDGYGSTDPAYPPRKDCTAPAGYAAMTGDCDDFHAPVHPNAPELCDLKDNDCDGSVDEDVVDQPYCQDNDGDGHGVPGGMMKVDCKPTSGFGDCGGDCDDRDPKVYPGAVEVCNGRDDTCDGKVDEGVKKVCGVGLCARYAAGCNSSCTPGDPTAETCNGYDDDCDGAVDNGDNASLCGDANVPCVQGHCVGGGTVGTGGSVGNVDSAGNAGRAAGGGSAPGGAVGLSDSSSQNGCSLGRGRLLGGASPGSVLTSMALLLAAFALKKRRAA